MDPHIQHGGTAGKLTRRTALGIDVNVRAVIFDANALNIAAGGRSLAMVEFLLDHGSIMDVSEPTRNPLFAAIHDGRLAIAQLLIDRGIDIRVTYNGKRMKNMDALAYARERGQTRIANLLEELLARKT